MSRFAQMLAESRSRRGIPEPDPIVEIRVTQGPSYPSSPNGTPRWKPETVSGEELTMSDGSIWFHPYHGGQPSLVRQPDTAQAAAINTAKEQA